jgi:hypothetical protein
VLALYKAEFCPTAKRVSLCLYEIDYVSHVTKLRIQDEEESLDKSQGELVAVKKSVDKIKIRIAKCCLKMMKMLLVSGHNL